MIGPHKPVHWTRFDRNVNYLYFIFSHFRKSLTSIKSCHGTIPDKISKMMVSTSGMFKNASRMRDDVIGSLWTIMGGGRGREACSGLSELHIWEQNSEDVEVSIPMTRRWRFARSTAVTTWRVRILTTTCRCAREVGISCHRPTLYFYFQQFRIASCWKNSTISRSWCCLCPWKLQRIPNWRWSNMRQGKEKDTIRACMAANSHQSSPVIISPNLENVFYCT